MELLINTKNIEAGSEFYETLIALNYSKKDIEKGIQYCKDARLIEPIIITTLQPTLKRIENNYIECKLTKKGEFYIKEISHWKEYRKHFGSGGKSLFDIHPVLTESQLSRDILEFMCGIIYCVEVTRPYMKVGKSHLYDYFMKHYGSFYTNLYEGYGGKISKPSITKKIFNREFFKHNANGNMKPYLATMYKQPTSNRFSLRINFILSQAQKREICYVDGELLFPKHMLNEDDVKLFIAENTSVETVE